MKLLLQSNGGFSGFYSRFILIDTDLRKMVKTDGLMKDDLTTAHRSDFNNKPLLWITRKDNAASNQLALKIGMHPDDTYNKSNEVWNCYRYS